MSVFLVIIAQYSFLTFHTLAELFAIVISYIMFAFAFSTHGFSKNNFLLFLACGYFWVGSLDLAHTLVYKDMNVFMEGSGNTAVQFWLAARHSEALLLLAAPFAARQRQNGYLLTAIFGIIALGLTFLILSGRFPIGFVEGKGLTDFKIYSEYLIDLILALALVALFRQGRGISAGEKALIAISIVLTMAAELAFTFYVDVFGLSNLAGHIFKLFSFWMIFQAVVISNLKKPYGALQESEENFRRLFENVDISIWNVDLSEVYAALGRLRQNGVRDLRQYLTGNDQAVFEIFNKIRVLHVNQATLTLFGAETEAEFLHQIGRTAGPDAISVYIDALCAIWEKRGVFRTEAAFRSLDGTVVYTILSFQIPEAGDGLLSIPVSIIDITQRRQIEETQRRLATAIDGVAENVSIYDANDRLIYANQALHDFYRENAEAISLGATFEDRMRVLLDRNKPAAAEGREEAWLKERLDRHRNPGKPFEMTQKSGVTMLISEQILPDGSTINIGANITERKRAELALRDSEEQFRQAQKMEALGHLTGGVAHDFNNVLAIILGNLGLVGSELKDDDGLKRLLDRAIDATERGAALTHRLLAFARKQTLDIQDVDVAALLAGMDNMLRRSLGETVEIRVRNPADLWLCEIDPAQLEQALLNLAVNARDAMPGGGWLAIETSNSQISETYAGEHAEVVSGDYVLLSVSDSGSGMTQEVQEQIFEPFFTTKDVGKGTGLGLSMVFGFIKQSRGHLTVYSEPGHGTTFGLYLPRSLAATITTVASGPEDAPRSKTGEVILVVEDDANLRDLVEAMLLRLGYGVHVTGDGREALSVLLAAPRVDLLLTDVVLPGGMSGLALAEMAHEERPALKVLCMSGYAEDAIAQHGRLAPGTEVLAKPFSLEDLGRKLRVVLDA
jgi:signal transduction histidine kinase/CheY-like chemotaxis protein